jgi:hypothetical protein
MGFEKVQGMCLELISDSDLSLFCGFGYFMLIFGVV